MFIRKAYFDRFTFIRLTSPLPRGGGQDSLSARHECETSKKSPCAWHGPCPRADPPSVEACLVPRLRPATGHRGRPCAGNPPPLARAADAAAHNLGRITGPEPCSARASSHRRVHGKVRLERESPMCCEGLGCGRGWCKSESLVQRPRSRAPCRTCGVLCRLWLSALGWLTSGWRRRWCRRSLGHACKMQGSMEPGKIGFSRNWGRVLLGHVLAALTAPGLGLILFMMFSYGASGLAHFGGVVAIGFGLLFSYLLYGAKSLIVVCLASPVFWLLSKPRSPLAAYGGSAAVAAFLGWFVGVWWFAGEEPGFIRRVGTATAITAVAAGVVIVFSWRSSFGVGFGAADAVESRRDG